MSLIADIFGKLRTPKNVVRKACFGGSFEKKHSKRVRALLKSQPDCLYHIYWSLWRQLIRKKSLLVTCKILRLVVNTFTADEKYSLLNRDNLGQPIHMQLSQKQRFLEDPSTRNMVNRRKHTWNLNKSTFTKFIYHCEENWVGKNLS